MNCVSLPIKCWFGWSCFPHSCVQFHFQETCLCWKLQCLSCHHPLVWILVEFDPFHAIGEDTSRSDSCHCNPMMPQWSVSKFSQNASVPNQPPLKLHVKSQEIFCAATIPSPCHMMPQWSVLSTMDTSGNGRSRGSWAISAGGVQFQSATKRSRFRCAKTKLRQFPRVSIAWCYKKTYMLCNVEFLRAQVVSQ